MKFFLQIKLIMWKNFTLRKRQKTRCIAEVVWPLFLFLILMWVRTRGLKEYIPECHFEQKAMPSVGPLPFLHSLVCSFNNTCHITTASASRGPNMTIVTQLLQDLERAAAVGEPAGGKDGFQTMSTDITALAQLLKNITIRTISVNSMLRGELLKHHIKQQNIQLNGEALNSLLNALVAVDNISSNQLGHEHYHLLCNATFLSQVIKNSTSDELGILANELCNISSQNLTNLLSLITSELDLAGTLKEQVDSLHSIEWRQLISILHKLSKNFITTDSYQNMINGVINFVDDYRKLTAESAHRNISSVYSSFLASQRLLCGQDMQTALNIVGGGEQFTRFQSVKELLKEIDKKSDVYINDTDASPECNDLFRKMETHYLTRFLWQQMKPFFRGKIVFAPNTPVVERVMERLNNNFEAVGRLKEIVDNWLNSTIPQVKDQLDTGASNALFIKNFTESQLGRQLLTWTLVPSEDVPGADILLQLVNRFMNDSNYRYEAYSALQELQSSISLFLECFEINKTEGYATEEDATVRGMELLLQNKLWAVVVFQDMKSDVLPPFVSYKIRTDSSRVDDTHQVEDRLRRPGPRRRPLIDLKYLTFGFAYLQDMVETSVIQEQTGTNHTPGIILQQFPYPCYIVDTFVLSISRTFPMFMTLSWVFTCSMIIKSVVYEKEHRLKETMRVMGLDNGTHWIGWFLDSLAPALFTITLLTIILVVRAIHTCLVYVSLLEIQLGLLVAHITFTITLSNE